MKEIKDIATYTNGIVWMPQEVGGNITITYGSTFLTKEDFIPVRIIYNPPYTICYFKNGDRIKVKCAEGEAYSKEFGVSACVIRKLFGTRGNFLKLVKAGHEVKQKGK